MLHRQYISYVIACNQSVPLFRDGPAQRLDVVIGERKGVFRAFDGDLFDVLRGEGALGTVPVSISGPYRLRS